MPKAAVPKLTKPAAAGGKKVAKTVYTIDCTKPAEDRIFDVAGFEKYLHDNMKVDGKPGQLGSLVEIARVESKIQVAATSVISKRYLKFLTKRYLKKSTLRDFVRVVATNKTTYTLSFFNIQGEDVSGGEEEDGEDMDEE